MASDRAIAQAFREHAAMYAHCGGSYDTRKIEARAAEIDASSPAVEGFALVPKEPTDAMLAVAQLDAPEAASRSQAKRVGALREAEGGRGEILSCGHPAALMLMSAETGLPLYCELCDALTSARDNASDAAGWREKYEALQAEVEGLVDRIVHVERSFVNEGRDASGNLRSMPTVTVTFDHNDWDARDKFAAALGRKEG
jgi:hypothetical protein